MGNRITVVLQDAYNNATSVYAHWLGDSAYDTVKTVLATTDRIGDDAYLSAQIIHALMAEGYDIKAGTGIGIESGTRDPLWDDNDPMFVRTTTGEYRIGDGEWVNAND